MGTPTFWGIADGVGQFAFAAGSVGCCADTGQFSHLNAAASELPLTLPFHAVRTWLPSVKYLQDDLGRQQLLPLFIFHILKVH